MALNSLSYGEELDVGYSSAPIDCSCLGGNDVQMLVEYNKAAATPIDANVNIVDGLVGWCFGYKFLKEDSTLASPFWVTDGVHVARKRGYSKFFPGGLHKMRADD